MKLTFIGADHEVTGSCYLIEACGKKFLVDCGMEQGKNLYENIPIPVPESQIDFVLLTHAHIDHSGNLPLLYAKGFRGPVYTTEATADLSDIMLRDSAHIQEFEAEWRNRKGKRAGKPEYVPPYTMKDALGVIELMTGQPYQTRFHPADGITVNFVDAGHLLGSASIEIWLKEDGIEKKIIFSGDIGNLNQPILRDPEYLTSADYVVMESTYGDRSHGPRPDYIHDLADTIQKTLDRGGNLVIPSFAVGRTQEMLYFIRQIKQENLVTGHGNFPVYVDSPLAIEATTVFHEHDLDCFDEEARELVMSGVNPIQFPGLRTSVTADESKAINFDEEPKIIISASGMCDAGRVKHHLKHNLWRPESTILFVGYQSVGTPGRALVDGADKIKLFGEEIAVKAEVKVLPGVSGHADNEGLMKWAASFKENPPARVFVCHGEDTVTDVFAARLKEELGYESYAPYSGTVFDLAANAFLEETKGIRIVKAEAAAQTGSKAKSGKNTVFERLLAAGQRLLTVIRHNEGGANKDLAKFTDQINSLCDKWDR
ncbi:MAG: MBL fold metallo-hydrolase [Eubacterium sp.]|nr:MBL fold metallo-hydrolase [Eubacterium sp.]